tara:strand:- start:3698 stop:4708 length:1011 start_codon:yes stop_codon:yes gene_type:complete
MILVTGASGMLGSQILLHAAQSGEKSLRGIYRSSRSLDNVKLSFSVQGALDKFNSIEWVKADLLDPIETDEAISGAKYIIHCAALVSPNKSDSDTMIDINPQISENVWSSGFRNNIIHGVHVSSISTFSYNPNENFINEESETKTENLSSYGKSKWASELIAWRFIAEGLSISVVSPSVILGCPAWNQGSSLILKRIKKGMPFYPPGSTGWVDVRDVADFTLKNISTRISGERFILNGYNASFKKTFSDIAVELNCNPPKWKTSYTILIFASIIESFYSKLSTYKQKLSHDSIRTVTSSVKYDATKSKLSGFQYRQWEETISALAKYCELLMVKNN